MRDKQSYDHGADYTSTGPDRYFDESLQYPKLKKPSPSSFSFHIDRKFVLVPSSFKTEKNFIRFRRITRPTSFATTKTTTHDSWQPVSKSLRDSPTDSPGSNGTNKTSECTEYDQDDYEDDLDSYCGSLTYSVESYALGDFPTEEIDEGYHAEDEYTSHLGRSCSSLYDDDDDHEDLDHYDCFVGHPCSFFFGGIQDWIRNSSRMLGSPPQEMAWDNFERTLRDRRRLYETNH